MRPLTVIICTPAPAGSRDGNRVTALRWARALRQLGCRVRLVKDWQGEPCDVLVALHARKSHASLVRHAARHPSVPRVLALTGTDVYADLHRADGGGDEARGSLELATRLVVLQPLAIKQIPERFQDRARTIFQSAVAPASPLPLPVPVPAGAFVALVLAHLREVKDPFLSARAVRLLPPDSPVHVVHLGRAHDEEMERRARAENEENPRWHWLGEHPRVQALRILGGASLLLVTSVKEGGANVVTEAIACGVPVISTRIDGSLGILGEDYPGYVEVGDAEGLSLLLARAAREPAFLERLRDHCLALRPLVGPARERQAWQSLLNEVAR